MGDSISSHSDDLPSAPTVASILGIKGSLRFRPHGSSQKAHVVLRRVEISDDSSDDGDSKPVVYYSLFAQKRIEVKPGKEILLAVTSPDGIFKDQAVIFEGDLPAVNDSSDEGETHVAEEEDDTALPLPKDVMPPKMRRAWGKRLEKVSPTTNGAPISPRVHTSIGIQVQPTCVSESIQTDTACVSVSVQTHPDYSSTSIRAQPSLASSSDSSRPHWHNPSAKQFASIRYTPTGPKAKIGGPVIQRDSTTQAVDEFLSDVESWEGYRSLSPMDLDSTASTPSQSPALVVTKLPECPQMDPNMDTNAVASSPASSIASSSNEPVVMDTHVPLSVTDAPLDVPSSKTTEIAVVPTSPPERCVKFDSLSSKMATVPTPTPHRRARKSLTPSMPQPRGISESNLSDQTPVARKSAVHNPFVSAGFIDEFVGATSRQTRASPNIVSPNHMYVDDGNPRQETMATDQPISEMAEPPSRRAVRQDGPSPHSLALPQNAVASGSKVLMTAMPSKAKSSGASGRSWTRPPPPLKRGPSQGANERLSPPDPKSLVYIFQGPIANPLNIKPSSNGLKKSARFMPPRAPVTSVPSTAKKRVVVGSGWPHVRQSNGSVSGSIEPPPIHPLSSSTTPKLQVQIPFPTTSPELPSLSCTREAAPTHASISPDISNIVSYTSPSPPPSSQPMYSPCTSNRRPAVNIDTHTDQGLINGRHPTSSPISRLNHSTLPHNSSIQGNTVTTSLRGSSPIRPKVELVDRGPPRSTTERESMFSSLGSRGSTTPVGPPRTLIAARAAAQSQSAASYSPAPGPVSVGFSYRSESRGIKRGISSSSQDLEALRPLRQRRRAFKWPTIDNLHSVTLKGEGDLGIRGIAFNSDGSQFALSCFDRTIRIWNNHSHTEIARLTQYSHVVSVAWIDGDSGVVSLADDGVVSKWTRSGQNHWQWAKLLDAGNDRRQDDDCVCFAYIRDRIAVAFPRIGVKVWLWIKGTWQPQRSILRQNVTSIKFVEDGEALLGGTRDGVLWYCQVPNGTLRAYTFLKSKVYSIDVNASESHALVAQTGGRSHLVGIRQDDHKGKIEQAYFIKDTDNYQASYEFGVVFASRGQAVLFGNMDGCVLVWDKNKGHIVSGLDHGKDDVIQTVASFDGSPSSKDGYLITGTKQGQLTWWAQPRLDDM